MANKNENAKSANITSAAALGGQSVVSIHAWLCGAVQIVEVVTGGGSTFIKFKQNRCDVGGTAEFGTGTLVF